MLNEEWMWWSPVDGLARVYRMKSMSDSAKELKMILKPEYEKGREISIIFSKPIAFYSRIEESYELSIECSCKDQYGQEIRGQWAFYKVNNSESLRMLLEGCDSGYTPSNLTHFAIVEMDSTFNVITSSEARIKFIEGE